MNSEPNQIPERPPLPPLPDDHTRWMDCRAYGITPEQNEIYMGGVNTDFDAAMTEIYTRNIEANLNLADKSNYVLSIFNSWIGERILVCGAGPSLVKNKADVQKAHECGVKIVCVDRALITLKSWGITPAAVISMDCQKTVTKYADWMDKNDTAIVGLHQSPRFVNRVKKRAGKVYFYLPSCSQSVMISSLFEKYDHDLFALRSSSSVGYVATDFALWMSGEKPRWIATVGNELCWKGINEIEDIYWHDKRFNLRWLQSVKNKFSCWTIDPFILTASSFLYFTQLHKVRFVDCSFGLVENFERKSLASLLAEEVN